MSEEGRFFTSLGSSNPTYIPGGADINGPIKIKENKFIREFFENAPVCMNKTGVVASGAQGAENVMVLGRNTFEYHMVSSGGTGTVISPQLTTDGLDVEMDGVDNAGAEICTGIVAANKAVFTVGTDAAFYAKLKFEIDDVSDFDDCAFGFRKLEAYQNAIDDYDEMACINVISGVINLETILNGGTTTTTDTTLADWVDGATHELEVLVSSSGVVTYKFDGSAPTVVAAFTFDDAEVVVPFFFFQHAAAAATGLYLKEFECGLQ